MRGAASEPGLTHRRHRLQAVAFFSSPATWSPFLESPETFRAHFGWLNSLCFNWALREVERARDLAADKQRVSFRDLHNVN